MDNVDYKVAEYLAALDSEACSSFCSQTGIDISGVVPFIFEDPAEVSDCLKCFIARGISPAYLISSPHAWGIYLCSLAEERCASAIQMLLATGNPANVMYYFRACYRIGIPAIEDQTSDALEVLYMNAFPSMSFLRGQSYDDDIYDPLIMDAVKMSSTRRASTGKPAASAIKKLDLNSADGSKMYEDLNSEKSRSIRPVVDPQEAFDFWCKSPVCRVHFSLKIDGVNTKMVCGDGKDEGLKLALSRGRAADSIDYTQAVHQLFVCKGVQDTLLSGRITGESFVGLDNLKIIQTKYSVKDYKTPKSTAMAMLRAPDNFDADDYKYLSFCAFAYNDLPPDVAFKKLEEAGLQTPPCLEFAGEDIPRTSIQDFNSWMEEKVLDPLYLQGAALGIGSDGVVMYLLADMNTERKDHYSDSNIAIKYYHWAPATYTSVVTGIVFDQRRVEASIVLELEPVVTRDHNTATRAGVGSPDILIRDGVKIGDRIEFTRKSEAYNVYLGKVSE